MMLVLDSEAVNVLATRSTGVQRVKAAMRAAAEAGADIVVPTVVLAELYRSSTHNAAINAMLSREHAALMVRDTDRTLASYVGGVLAPAATNRTTVATAGQFTAHRPANSAD